MAHPPALSKALQPKATEPGVYKTLFPQAVCFGAVVYGGMVTSYISQAAKDFFSKNPKTSSQTDVRSLSVQFLRPTFPDPVPSQVTIRPVSLGRLFSTAHVELTQKSKVCVAGYITVTDLSLPGENSFDTKWTLSPPPPPVSHPALETDSDSGWVSYHHPFTPTGVKRMLSYVKYFVPLTFQDASWFDQWVAPGWDEPDSPNSARWTNSTVDFASDIGLTIIDNFFPEHENVTGSHAYFVKQARAQREGRLDVKSANEHNTPGMHITLTLQTEIKKKLPEEGVKWLFVRNRAKMIQGDRMDMEIMVLDEAGELVAITNQVVQIASMKVKTKKAKI